MTLDDISYYESSYTTVQGKLIDISIHRLPFSRWGRNSLWKISYKSRIETLRFKSKPRGRKNLRFPIAAGCWAYNSDNEGIIDPSLSTLDLNDEYEIVRSYLHKRKRQSKKGDVYGA